MSSGVVASVIAQHAEEAGFLWILRSGAACAPNYSLKDLAKLDDRVTAHIDGLRLGGDAALEIVKEMPRTDSSVFVLAVLCCAGENEAGMEEVIGVSATAIELMPGLVSAMEWSAAVWTMRMIEALLISNSPRRVLTGLMTITNLRRDARAALASGLRAEDTFVRAKSLQAAGELGRVDQLANVQQSTLDETDPECRFRAAWSAVLLGDMQRPVMLREIAENGGPVAESAADLASRRMPSGEVNHWYHGLGRRSESMRLAPKVAAAHGDSACVPWLIERMSDPRVSRAAGEAMSMITGLDLEICDLDGPPPQGSTRGPNDDPADEKVALDPDEDLPFPDVARVEAWWSRERSRFTPGVRYLCGRPINVENAMRVLREGKQRQRAAAALELALLQPGRPLFNVAAPAWRQREWLARGTWP